MGKNVLDRVANISIGFTYGYLCLTPKGVRNFQRGTNPKGVKYE
jgi:hypothetical protein